jgi:hypothetical protein
MTLVRCVPSDASKFNFRKSPTIGYNGQANNFRTRLIISVRGMLAVLADPNSTSDEVLSFLEEIQANTTDLTSYLESKSPNFWKDFR